MLAKNIAIEIPSNDPFAHDKLDRKQIALNLTRLVESTNQPFVISIQAPWGWGKTTFINMWKSHLESSGHICLYFNAWENDFVEDPLIAFIGEISKALVEKRYKGKAQSHLKKLQSIGGKIIRRSIPLAIQIGTQGLLSQDGVKKVSDLILSGSDEIASYASELAKDKIQQYEKDKNSVVEFKKELGNFAKAISENNANKMPLVFFIDELDRCRPDFAISLIERVKHIFSVEGIVFVLGIDRNQMAQSTKTLYGNEMDEDGYLRRFIDITINLPEPSAEGYCQSLFAGFKLYEVFNKRRNGSEEQKNLLNSFVSLSKDYNLSLRVIEQCFIEINLVLRTLPTNFILFPHFLALLVAFKAYKPKTYSLLQNDLSYPKIKKILDEIKQDLNITSRQYFWMLTKFEAYLLLGYLYRDDKLEEPIKELKDIANGHDNIANYAKKVLESFEQIQSSLYYGAVVDLVARIGLISNLTSVD